MSIESEITIGTIAIVKVGRNEVEVTVTEITANGWKVKSQSTGREFEVKRIERIINEQPVEAVVTAPAEEHAPEAEASEAPAESEPEEDNTPNPAPESGKPENPEKKLSLLDAAVKVLETCRVPMNTKELVAKAIEMHLWVSSGAKTPEQTLYSGIFREMKAKEQPRIVKAEEKGKFRIA